MARHKVEVFLKGEFTTIDVKLEGNEIALREIEDNVYYKLYTEFEIQDSFDIHVRLKGWTSMAWEFRVKIGDNLSFEKNGIFDSSGFVTFTISIPM